MSIWNTVTDIPTQQRQSREHALGRRRDEITPLETIYGQKRQFLLHCEFNKHFDLIKYRMLQLKVMTSIPHWYWNK